MDIYISDDTISIQTLFFSYFLFGMKQNRKKEKKTKSKSNSLGGHQPTPSNDNEPSACRAPQKGWGSFLDDGSAWIIIIIIINNTNHTDTLHASCTT